MRNFKMVTAQSLQKLAECFTDSEELTTFLSHLNDLTEELVFQNLLAKQVTRIHEDNAVVVYMKEICILCLFLREHMELIHQLIQAIDTKTIDEDEMKTMMSEEQ